MVGEVGRIQCRHPVQVRTGPQLWSDLPRLEDDMCQVLPGDPPADACPSTLVLRKLSGLPWHILTAISSYFSPVSAYTAAIFSCFSPVSAYTAAQRGKLLQEHDLPSNQAGLCL